MAEQQRPHRVEAALSKLRPTQLTAGFAEVVEKRAAWKTLDKKARRALLESHVFPAVQGPGGRYYMVDHHHLGLALIEEGVKRTGLLILSDLSYLTPEIFWRVMEVHDWVHPFDQAGNRQSYDAIPQKLTELVDDPYRSLAGFLRSAGGFAKDASPFAEFLWADYLRPHIPSTEIAKSMDTAVLEAMGLARSPLARYLPGWSGVTSTVESTKRRGAK